MRVSGGGTEGRMRGRTARRAAVLVLAMVLVAVGCEGGWTGPHAGPGQTGFNEQERVIGVHNVATLTLKGSRDLASPLYSVVAGEEHLFWTDGGGLYAAGTDRIFEPLWNVNFPTLFANAPVVKDGRVFAMSATTYEGTAGMLRAYDAKRERCDFPQPIPCEPLWEAPVGNMFASPTVSGGVVYVTETKAGTDSLRAYDAAGTVGCAGTPRVCTPLWTAPIVSAATPVVANGRVYVTAVGSTNGHVEGFDAKGSTGCGGTPKVCTPLWKTEPVPGQAVFSAVADGRLVVYSGNTGRVLSVFDAEGTAGCSGSPAVCAPLWTASVAASGVQSHPAIAYGNIFVPTNRGIAVFDLAGNSGCSGTPKRCDPLRFLTVDPGNIYQSTGPFASFSVANGVGYMGWTSGDLAAFDVRSTTNCTGSPLQCPALWRTNLGSEVRTTVAVTDGTIIVGTLDKKLRAFAPAG